MIDLSTVAGCWWLVAYRKKIQYIYIYMYTLHHARITASSPRLEELGSAPVGIVYRDIQVT